MALDFPSSPTNGQVYDNFYYDATKGVWKSLSSGASPNYITDAVISATAPNATTTPLTVKGAASQTAVLQEWKNSANANLASLWSNGEFWAQNRIVGRTPNNAGSTGGLAVMAPSGGSQTSAYVQFVDNLYSVQWAAIEATPNSVINLSASQVRMPSQPSFRAYLWQLGSNPSGTITFNTVDHNIGGHFNQTNGRFTAPVAGRYLFSFHAFREANQSGNWVVNFYVNGSYKPSRAYDDSDSVSGYGPNTALVDIFNLNANDYVNVVVTAGNLHGNDNCFFSGHLLG